MADIQHEQLGGDGGHTGAQSGSSPSGILSHGASGEWSDKQRVNDVDDDKHIPDLHRSESDSNTVRPSSKSGHYVVKPEDVRELTNVPLEKVQQLVMNYNALNIPKEPVLIFLQHLTARPDAWFVEIGHVGLVYLSNIILNRDADLNVLFWDGKLRKDRKAAVRAVIAAAFKQFQLPRISAILPSTNPALQRLLGDVGLQTEGTIRKGWGIEPPVDSVYMGILKEEATWPVIPLASSSA
jgi:hypothetical protein